MQADDPERCLSQPVFLSATSLMFPTHQGRHQSEDAQMASEEKYWCRECEKGRYVTPHLKLYRKQ
jgi:hypothetical protein